MQTNFFPSMKEKWFYNNHRTNFFPLQKQKDQGVKKGRGQEIWYRLGIGHGVQKKGERNLKRHRKTSFRYFLSFVFFSSSCVCVKVTLKKKTTKTMIAAIVRKKIFIYINQRCPGSPNLAAIAYHTVAMFINFSFFCVSLFFSSSR